MRHNEEHQIPRDAIQAIGERSRSAEFKEARNRLSDSVNDWLRGQVTARNASDNPVTEPRIVHTNLGPVSSMIHMIGEEFREGSVVLGDPNKDPLVYQRVVKKPTGETEVTTIQGSDPLAVAMYGDTYSFERQTETIAAFGTRTIYPDQSETNFRYVIKGDGGVDQLHIDQGERQVNVSTALRNDKDIAMAQLAFSTMAQEQGVQ